MKEPGLDDRLDVNSGKERSETDLFDLANKVRLKNRIEEIAMFCAGRAAKCATKSQSWSEPANSLGALNKPPLTLREAEAIIPICAIEERPCGP